MSLMWIYTENNQVANIKSKTHSKGDFIVAILFLFSLSFRENIM